MKIRLSKGSAMRCVVLWASIAWATGAMAATYDLTSSTNLNGVNWWLGSTNLIVGSNSVGLALSITNAGNATFALGFVGYAAGASNNSIYISDPGSCITQGFNTLNIGYNGKGNNLIINNGAFVQSTTGIVGNFSSAVGNSVSVTGKGSLWTNWSDIYIGNSGTRNALNISNSGTVINAVGYIGYAANALSNVVTVSGAGSAWTNRGQLFIGYSGIGNKLTITNGGSVYSSSRAQVGYSSGANGNSVTIDGVGSTWAINNGDLCIGESGAGNSLTIQNGGTQACNSAFIGDVSGADNNSVTVNGTGTWWHVANSCYVGYAGVGNRLTVSGGAQVNLTSLMLGNSSANNSVVITGGGSKISGGGYYIGYGAPYNSLTISNGGQAVNLGFCYIGGNNSSNNSLVVTGTNSLFSPSGVIVVGWNGRGANNFTIDNGATVNDTGGTIGNIAAAVNNMALVKGPGSVWNNNGGLAIGANSGGNQLTITNGALVNDTVGYIGNAGTATNNLVTVAGGGAVWSNSGSLYIGSGTSYNNNTLIIGHDAMVLDASAYVGQGSSNTVALIGSGSVWSNSGSLSIGNGGERNLLTINAGAKVYDVDGTVGSGTSNNNAVVNGAGALWQNSGSLTIGVMGSGQNLLVTNGGTVYSASGAIGSDYASTSNSVIVTGNASVWSNSGSLLLGGGIRSGNHYLLVSDGGTVFSSNIVVGAGTTTSNNQMIVAGGRVVSTNSLNSGSLEIRRGSLNLNGGSISVDNYIMTNGSSSLMSFTAGLLQAGNALVSNGQAFQVGDGVQAAQYAVRGGAGNFADGIAISSNAILSGNGSVNNASLSGGASLAPGTGALTLAFDHLTLNSAAIVVQTISDADSYELLVATNLTVTGQVLWHLALAGAMLPEGASLKLFEIGQYGGALSNNWLSLDGLNPLNEGAEFSLADTNGVIESFQLSYMGGSGCDVTLSVVPEPMSCVIFSVFACGLLAWHRFRRWNS